MAAAEIGLTQSAVSQQIRALENRLGVNLFRRHARGIELTDDGRRLLPNVELAIETLTSATGSFDLASNENLLTVAASVSIIQWVLSPRLDDFLALNPGVSVRFQSTIWPDDFSTLRGDVEIRFGSVAQAGRDARELFPHQLVAVRAPDVAGDVRNGRLIEAVGVSDGWSDWGRVAGMPGLKPSVFVDSYGMAMQLAADGAGIALVSAGLAGLALAGGKLVIADPLVLPAREGYFLAVESGNELARSFASWIMEVCNPPPNSGNWV